MYDTIEKYFSERVNNIAFPLNDVFKLTKQ